MAANSAVAVLVDEESDDAAYPGRSATAWRILGPAGLESVSRRGFAGGQVHRVSASYAQVPAGAAARVYGPVQPAP